MHYHSARAVVFIQTSSEGQKYSNERVKYINQTRIAVQRRVDSHKSLCYVETDSSLHLSLIDATGHWWEPSI